MYHHDGTTYPRWGLAMGDAALIVERDPNRIVLITNDAGALVARVEWRTPKGQHPRAQVRIHGQRGYGPWTDTRLCHHPRQERK